MSDERLLTYVNQEIKAGKSHEQIKTSLLSNGWSEQAVQEVLPSPADSQSPVIQKPLLQFPEFIDRLSHHKRIVIGIGVALLLFMSFSLLPTSESTDVVQDTDAVDAQEDPTEKRASRNFIVPTVIPTNDAASPVVERDLQRKEDIGKIMSALLSFYEVKSYYPSSLAVLVELGELESMLYDPRTNQQYKYAVLNNGNSFKLCVTYESEVAACLTEKSSFPE